MKHTEQHQRGTRPAEHRSDILAGRHAVMEAMKAGRGINRILLADGLHGRRAGAARPCARVWGCDRCRQPLEAGCCGA